MSYLQFLLGLAITVGSVWLAPISMLAATIVAGFGMFLVYRHIWHEATSRH